MVKHIRTDTGWIPDINAVLQVIEKVFDACESIIAATDASREGKMVFRVPLPVSGMQETLPPSMDLVTYGRSRAGRNGQPQARQPV